jgi:bidirectional [NiFe] hydrogenase diaphorase subunit
MGSGMNPSATRAEREETSSAPAHPSGDKRFKMLDATMKRLQYKQDTLIEVLHAAQELFGYLEDDLLRYACKD